MAPDWSLTGPGWRGASALITAPSLQLHAKLDNLEQQLTGTHPYDIKQEADHELTFFYLKKKGYVHKIRKTLNIIVYQYCDQTVMG